MSIKITPDKYPQIIEVYNTEGKTAAYDLMRSCYEIKNPTCVMKMQITFKRNASSATAERLFHF